MPERQTRRHLTAAEAELALGRGKEIEILLGSCGDASRPGLRFANLSRDENSLRLSVFEMVDMKDPQTYFAAQQFQMRDSDIVYVANSKMADLQRFVNILASSILPLSTVRNAVR